MPPLFMDSPSESTSPSSVSAGEEHATNSQETGGRAVRRRPDHRGKRREKNRNAARKSRKKQTERADELHEELQHLENCNSTLVKEIDELRRDLQLYTKTLESHRPVCRLRASPPASAAASAPLQGSSSPPRLHLRASPPTSAAASAPLQGSSSPPRLHLRASPPTSAATSAPLQGSSSPARLRLRASPPASVAASSSPPRLPLLTSNSTQDTNFLPLSQLSASASPAASLTQALPGSIPLQTSYSGFSTSLTSSLGLHALSTHLLPSNTNTSNFLSSRPPPHPSISSSVVSPPRTLFGEGPPPLTNAALTPVYTSFVSTLPPSGQGTFHVSSTNALLPQTNRTVLPPYSHHFDMLDALLTKKPLTPYTSAPPTPPRTDNVGLGSSSTPLLHPGHGSGTLNHEDPALRSLSAHSVPLQTHLDLLPAFTLKPGFSQQNTAHPTPLLSFLTVPSPFFPQDPPSLPPLADPSGDLSLSELLESNDWLLS